MKTLRYVGMAVLAIMLCVNFTACSDDEDEEKQPTTPPEETPGTATRRNTGNSGHIGRNDLENHFKHRRRRFPGHITYIPWRQNSYDGLSRLHGRPDLWSERQHFENRMALGRRIQWIHGRISDHRRQYCHLHIQLVQHGRLVQHHWWPENPDVTKTIMP